MRPSPIFNVLCVMLALLAIASSADGALPKETRDKISAIRKELGGVSRLLRDDKLDEVASILKESKDALDEIERTAGPDNANDRGLVSAQKYLLDQKARYLKKKGVSFAADIAPIFNERCMRCHGDRASGGLDLSSYAAMARGGRNTPLLVPGSSRRSLLMAKLAHPDEKQRMPKNGARLSDDELLLVSLWIDTGAKFDGDDPQMLLGDLIRAAKRPNMEKIDVPKATGKETVSFTKDIAPFMVRLCLNCHRGNNPSGGLSLETFERMMQGGDSGRVIIPGNVEGSRMFRLVGGLENPRMPNNNQLLLTRKNYEDFKKWFEEGNKFDGDSIKTPLTELAPSNEEMRAAELAKLTEEQWEKMRIERTADQWKRTLPNDPGGSLEGEEFLIWGNVGATRMKQINQMATKHLDEIKSMFGDKSKERTFRGRLAVIVFKDRLGYEEFLFTVERQQPERSMIGHSKVTESQEDAYIVLQDVGDEPAEDQMNLETSLVTQLTNVYLQQTGADLPGWVSRGTGMYIASKSGETSYFKTLPDVAAEALNTITQPQQIFADGTFSPAQTSAVGYTLVRFMISNGGTAKFGQFVARLRNGSSVDAAAKAVYRSDARTIARAYSRTLPRP
jgi:mono/diheme cytochrome c family protein